VMVATAEALGVDLLVIGAHSQRSFLDVLWGDSARWCRRARRGTPSRTPPWGDEPSGVRRGRLEMMEGGGE
jgi:hypothetical protein